MEKFIEEQLMRSEHLKNCLDIVKVIGNPEVEHLTSTLKTTIDKVEELLEKRKNLLEEKDRLRANMRELTRKCNEEADRVEQIYEHINEQINMSTDLEGSDYQVSEKENNFFEVSPCPSDWAKGSLNTPGSLFLNQTQTSFAEDFQTQYIKFIDTEEMRTTPAYMKGRLTSENINHFIDTLNSVLKKKYAIVNLKKKEVKRKDLMQYCNWKSQEMEYNITGIYFTAEDLLTLGNTKIDKVSDKIIQVLRHTRRLRQCQVNKKLMLYYVI